MILDDDVRYCPKCGKDVSAVRNSDIPSIKVGTLLTSANLHRIRQEWDEAITDATEAMRLDPANADIASLLGSIYEQREMLDDAAIWYEIAVEMNPESTADVERLNQVKAQAAAKRSNKKGSFEITQKRTRLLALALGGLCLLIVFMALIVSFMRPHNRQDGRSPEPNEIIDSRSQSPQGAFNTPATSLEAQNPVGAEDPTQDQQPSDLAGTPAAKTGSLRTSPELKINNALLASQKVQEAGAKVDDVIADPRQSTVVVTFSIASGANLSKDAVLKAAYAVAVSTFDSHSQVSAMTARCLVTMGNASTTQIAFVGDIERKAMQGIPQNAKAEQMLAAFTNPWWNPQIN